jgi:hypothetical protein
MYPNDDDYMRCRYCKEIFLFGTATETIKNPDGKGKIRVTTCPRCGNELLSVKAFKRRVTR